MTFSLIRCDSSLSIGSGHVIRCRTLARELKRRGQDIVFLCRRQNGDLISLLQQEFTVLSLPERPLVDCTGLNGRQLYKAWLGCDQSQDVFDCLHVLSNADYPTPNWLIVDHYGLDSFWQDLMIAGLRTDFESPQLLVIDDLADRPHKADLLLDQNFYGCISETRYQGLIPSHCRQLLGPNYALLGPEYGYLHSLVPLRTDIRRVLIFFGGVDKDNLTARTLEALTDSTLSHLSVDVVLGFQSIHCELVEELVARRPFTSLYRSISSLAGLMARADLAIGAGGSTTWERACLNLPSLVITVASNQHLIASSLHEAGFIDYLGDSTQVSCEQIRNAVVARISDPAHHHFPNNFIDGLGSTRLAFSILGPQSSIFLRKAEASDEALLLHWANDPDVRSNSFSSDPISSSDHHQWFFKGLTDPDRLLLIALSDGFPIGQIRFDRKFVPIDGGRNEALVDLSLDRCARGFGLSPELVRLGLMFMLDTWGSDIQVVAEVLLSNHASNSCFLKSGFVQDHGSPFYRSSQPVIAWRWIP